MDNKMGTREISNAEQEQLATPTLVATPSRAGFGILTTALVSTCITLIALFPIGYTAYKHSPAPLATVDLQKIVEEDQKRLLDLIGASGGNVSDDKRAVGEKMTAEFAKRLSTAVEQLGLECHCVIINKAALLAGTATDYTDLLRERIKK
jgi:hypothetical protein